MKLLRLAAAACAALLIPTGVSTARPAAAMDSREESRQILVMLRLSPDHYRPNSSYGGDYGDRATGNARRRLAQRIAKRNGLELVETGWPMPLLGIDCYVMRVPGDAAVDAAIARVAADPQVAWSQPMQLYRARADSDPLFATQPAASLWRLADLHRIATGRGVTVAVVDSKIDTAHPDLAGQFVADRDFVTPSARAPELHGTEVAGIIAAKADNGVGIAGIAPGARLMALRACWQDGATADATFCTSLSLAKAIDFAIQRGAKVINLSLAGPPDRLLEALLQAALVRNIAVVAAFDPTLPGGGFPASKSGVIAVANEGMASLPPHVYAAPGQDVPTTQPGGKWYLVDGSSFSAAHVSGLIALVREEHASAPVTALVATGTDGGAVDACATLLRQVSKSCDCACAVSGALADSVH